MQGTGHQGTRTADDVLRLLLAGGRLAAEPGVRVADLDRVVVRLTSRDPGVDSDGQAQRVLTDLLPHLWEAGWQPADVVHVVRRRATQRAARLAATVITGSVPAGTGTPAAWSAQLAALDTRGGTVAEWWRAEGTAAAAAWREVLRVIGVLRGLPRVEELLPPPSRWAAGAQPDATVVGDERVLSRVRGLLAKAESTEFAAEAEALTAKAQELMARYAIDAAMGGPAPGPGAGGVTARRFHLDDPHVEAKAAVLQGVAAANGVRVVLMPAFGIATLVGFAADLDLVELLVTSLLVQAGRALDLELRGGGARTRSTAWRRGFWLAYAARVAERLTEARDAARTEARATYGSALVPLLADREAAVERAVEELFPRVRRRQGPMVDPAGWDAGRRAADEADLGGGRRALPR